MWASWCTGCASPRTVMTPGEAPAPPRPGSIHEPGRVADSWAEAPPRSHQPHPLLILRCAVGRARRRPTSRSSTRPAERSRQGWSLLSSFLARPWQVQVELLSLLLCCGPCLGRASAPGRPGGCRGHRQERLCARPKAFTADDGRAAPASSSAARWPIAHALHAPCGGVCALRPRAQAPHVPRCLHPSLSSTDGRHIKALISC